MSRTPRSAAGHVVIFTGQSSYNALSYLSRDLAHAMLEAGYSSEVLDLRRVSIPTELRRLQNGGDIAFFCAYSGLGADILAADGRAIYDAVGIPYIGLMLDNPCYFPSRHMKQSSQVILLHGDDGHHDVSVSISPKKSLRGLFRLALSRWTEPLLPIAERRREVIFASKGGNPARYESMLEASTSSTEIRFVLSLADVLAGGETPRRVWDTATALAPNAELNARWHSLVSHADHLARIRRASAVARALRGLPVTFVGGDWEHVKSSADRATFLPGAALPEVRRLMAASAFTLNVQPGTTDSVHDRFLLGLHAGAAVISDSNRFIDSQIGRECFVHWDGSVDTVADSVAQALGNASSGAMQERAALGLKLARTSFALDTLVLHLERVLQAQCDGQPLPSPDPAFLPAKRVA